MPVNGERKKSDISGKMLEFNNGHWRLVEEGGSSPAYGSGHNYHSISDFQKSLSVQSMEVSEELEESLRDSFSDIEHDSNAVFSLDGYSPSSNADNFSDDLIEAAQNGESTSFTISFPYSSTSSTVTHATRENLEDLSQDMDVAFTNKGMMEIRFDNIEDYSQHADSVDRISTTVSMLQDGDIEEALGDSLNSYRYSAVDEYFSDDYYESNIEDIAEFIASEERENAEGFIPDFEYGSEKYENMSKMLDMNENNRIHQIVSSLHNPEVKEGFRDSLIRMVYDNEDEYLCDGELDIPEETLAGLARGQMYKATGMM